MESIEQLSENSNWFNLYTNSKGESYLAWVKRGRELFLLDIIVRDIPHFSFANENDPIHDKLIEIL